MELDNGSRGTLGEEGKKRKTGVGEAFMMVALTVLQI